MTTAEAPKTPVTPRDAASLVLLRESPDGVRVLMGQRGKGAKFMPSRMVFPGGSLDAEDRAKVAALRAQADAPCLDPRCADRLCVDADEEIGLALARAAIRETQEETGIELGPNASLPPDRLRFFFRAITPPSRPIRFDARFFLARAGDIHGSPDDFSGADGELSRLDWYPLTEARDLPLAFITHIVLAETAAAIETMGGVDALFEGAWERPVPYFRHDSEGAVVLRL